MNCSRPRMRLRILMPMLMLAVLMAAPAARAAQFAAIVVDARNGKVLYSRNADTRVHPASLTKMMTLYLTFEAIRRGQLRLDQRVRVSRNAANERPSRLGLKAGQLITVRDLIRAAAIKSANDAATALAEAVGGSEKRFARMMTAKARELGMTRTRFLNPHGLTRRHHLTTARDMAKLGRRLMFDFPEYFNIFSRKKSRTAIRTVWNTNRLLGRYKGMDGIKTGYTVAAGYNLAASARRGSKRIIVVVMGARSSRLRNAKVAELLDLGFRRAPAHVRTVPPRRLLDPLVMASSPPPRRGHLPPGLVERSVTTIARAVATPAAAATLPPPGLVASAAAPARSTAPRRRPGSDRPTDTRIASAGTIRPRPRPLDPEAQWFVQLGRYKERDYALRVLRKATRSPVQALRRARASVEGTVVHGLQLYEARLIGLTEKSALDACVKLQARGQRCRPLPPGRDG